MGELFDRLVAGTPDGKPWNSAQLLHDIAQDAQRGAFEDHGKVLQLLSMAAGVGFGDDSDSFKQRVSTRTVLLGFITARIQEAEAEALALLDKPGGFEQIEAVVADLEAQIKARNAAETQAGEQGLNRLLNILKAAEGDVDVIDLGHLFGHQKRNQN